MEYEYLYWLSNLAHTERELASACDAPTWRMYYKLWRLARLHVAALARWEQEARAA